MPKGAFTLHSDNAAVRAPRITLGLSHSHSHTTRGDGRRRKSNREELAFFHVVTRHRAVDTFTAELVSRGTECAELAELFPKTEQHPSRLSATHSNT